MKGKLTVKELEVWAMVSWSIWNARNWFLLRAKVVPISWHTPQCHDSVTRLPAHVEASRKNTDTQPDWNSLSYVVLSLHDASGHEQLYISLGFTNFLIKFYLHCQKKKKKTFLTHSFQSYVSYRVTFQRYNALVSLYKYLKWAPQRQKIKLLGP